MCEGIAIYSNHYDTAAPRMWQLRWTQVDAASTATELVNVRIE